MKILQFGTGRFLRGFFDPIVETENSITVLQSRSGSSGARLINQSVGGYHVWTRGKHDGSIIDEFQLVQSLDRALVALDDWPQIRQLILDPEYELVVSNTTESGLQLNSQDDQPINLETDCPTSYPARLLSLLFARFENNTGGVTILPMELVEYNADKLKQLVLQQAECWPQTNRSDFTNWLNGEVRWLSNLVDRIVVSMADPPPWNEHDPLAVMAEPYRLLAIEDDGGDRNVIPNHPMVCWTDDLAPKFLRKVRILNGLHTAMVSRCLPLGFSTVLEVVSDPKQREWLGGLLHDEILPVLNARGMDEKGFAGEVLERFENPFFEHKLSDIAKDHATKLTTRIEPTAQEFEEIFGRAPTKLTEVLEASTASPPFTKGG